MSQASAPRARARGLRPALPRRLTMGSVVPLVVAVLAGGSAYAALRDRSAMTDILVARQRIPAGTSLNAGDLRLVSLHASDLSVARGLLKTSEVGRGWVAAVAIAAGEPVTASEVALPEHGPAMEELSIAVPVSQAAGGRAQAGDMVDVIAAGGNRGAHYVAEGLRVIAVAPTSAPGDVLGGGTGNYFVVVAVGKQTALRLVAALGSQEGGGSGGVDIVRSMGTLVPGLTSSPVAPARAATARARR